MFNFVLLINTCLDDGRSDYSLELSAPYTALWQESQFSFEVIKGRMVVTTVFKVKSISAYLAIFKPIAYREPDNVNGRNSVDYLIEKLKVCRLSPGPLRVSANCGCCLFHYSQWAV